MRCLECNQEIERLDNGHLAECCGLTLQEYAFRHNQSLDVLVPTELLNYAEPVDEYVYCDTTNAQAQLMVQALRITGHIIEQDDFCVIRGEIRRLDQLLWIGHHLSSYGFWFRQEYVLNDETHRVVAVNVLKTRKENLAKTPSLNLETISDVESLYLMTILLAVSAVLQGGYIFLSLANKQDAEALQTLMQSSFNIHLKILSGVDENRILLRSLTLSDAESLLNLLKNRLSEIPCASAYFYEARAEALVAKEVVFDSAHFITDHPGKCANLHGGRYRLIVKIYDRVDPYTGFVIDYGYLKKIIQREVVEKLDHKHLNLVDSTLVWRSSTEYLNIFIWNNLIEYLPNLFELQTYETDESYCCFQGPTLDEIQSEGVEVFESYFTAAGLGKSQWRSMLGGKIRPRLRIVRND